MQWAKYIICSQECRFQNFKYVYAQLFEIMFFPFVENLDWNPWYTVSLAMIGKFQIAASFAVIYVYAGELMPTVVRSEAMGISSFVAGIGLLLFPYINALVSFHILNEHSIKNKS